MTHTDRPARTRGAMINFSEARAADDRAAAVRRHQAARTVADHSLDARDCRELLLMLGLSGREPDTAPPHDTRVPAPQRDQYAHHSYPGAHGQPGQPGQPKEHLNDPGNHQVVQW